MYKYSVDITWSEEDKGFVATSSEFPTISAFGETDEEALAEFKTVLEGAIEVYKEEGWSLPDPVVFPEYSGQFRLRVPKSLHAAIASQAKRDGVSLNSWISTVLAERVGEKKELRRIEEMVRRSEFVHYYAYCNSPVSPLSRAETYWARLSTASSSVVPESGSAESYEKVLT